MYLVELDPKTGLVMVDKLNDGLMAIEEFRIVIQDKDLGIPCMTAIAITADWQSPIRYFTIEDRPKMAMYTVARSRTAYVWDREEIQNALKKYDELQYNPELEEKRKLDELLTQQLLAIEKEKEPSKKIELFNQLKTIKDLLKSWLSQNENQNLFSDAPVVNGYKLSRLETKALDRHSFYNRGK